MVGLSLADFSRQIGLAALAAAICLGLLLVNPAVGAAQEVQKPLVATYGTAQSSFADVVAGGSGTAYLVYYLPDNGPEQPALAVRLSRDSSEADAVAEVFDTPPGEDYVPVRFEDGIPVISDSLHPAAVLTSPEGWWVRDGLANYNLDILIYGQVPAMWGAFGLGQHSWPNSLDPDQRNAQITVRDTNGDGLPDWDWRTMMPDFPFRSDFRTNYVESKCDTPVEIKPGVSPQWPYVAAEGYYEQERDEFRPPIVVDWESGRIQFISELVSVRNQSCSYALYSISRVLPGELNHPNFESPFALYDLSGERSGYPNLLIRTQRFVENDTSIFLHDNPETQFIRYSWRNDVGDWQWDYKVEVLGQYNFDAQTPIAGSSALIDVPDYEAFPSWVIERKWPAVTFVAPEEGSYYRSSEGIYEWSPLELPEEYYFGWQQEPDLSIFEDIRVGFRGEYRLNSARIAEAYLSPVDNRLHLKWAENGLWRLDEDQVVRLANLNDDETIDVWSREMLAISAPEENLDNAADSKVEEAPQIIEALYALDGHFLHSDDSGVTVVASEYDPIIFETLPPTDRETWQRHRAILAPYVDQRSDPGNLYAWLDSFPGTRSQIGAAALVDVRTTSDGFRFEINLEPDFDISGTDTLGLEGLSPGSYSVENKAGTFTAVPIVPSQISLAVQPVTGSPGAGAIQVSINNDGNVDVSDLMLVAEIVDVDGTVTDLAREPVGAPAGKSVRRLIDASSLLIGAGTIHVRLENPEGQIMAKAEPLALAMPDSKNAAVFGIWHIPVLVPLLLLFVAFLAGAAILAVARQRKRSTI